MNRTPATLVLLAVLGTASVVWGQGAPKPPAPPAGGGGKGGVPLIGAGPQVTTPLPADDYFLAFAPYYAGDFLGARRMFQEAAKGGIRTIDSRWIDSICYHTMIGECAYQMGDLVQALDQHNSALKLYLANADWMLRVDFPLGIDPANVSNLPPLTWGSSGRKVMIGAIPDIMQTLQGQSDAANARAVQQGGVVAQAQFYKLRAQEVARCIAVSIRRRNELLGPNAPHDPMTALLIDTLSRRLAPANHWSQCWIDAQLGLAYLGAGRHAQAASELQKSLAAGGTYEHKLSAMALVELGKLTLALGQYDNALLYFMEATYSAAAFSQFDVMEEGFRGALITHLASGKKTFFAPLQNAAAWSRRQSPLLEASLCTLAGDNCTAIGETAQAVGYLTEARRALGRHDMLGGAIGARFQYEFAKASFQSGNLAAGNTALALAMNYMNNSSRWLYQITVADALYTNGIVTDRAADLLFADLLREPQSADWLIEPIETLAVAMTYRRRPLEHWFEVAMKRREGEKALQIVDRIRRQQFFASLPLGGRTLALRWILAGPAEAIGDKGNQQRRDLLARHPRFAELARTSADLREVISRDPLPGDDPEKLKELQARYDQWAKVSALQELMLHDIALEREPADFVFPPILDIKDLQSRLPERSLILTYFNGSKDLFGFALSKDKFAVWKVEGANKVRSEMGEMLRKLGLRDRTQPLDMKDLKDSAWRTLAQKILPPLTNHAKPENWDSYQEVILIPDGPLWYLPFELLPVGPEDETVPLLQKVRVRYVPMVGLALPDGRPIKAAPKTAAVAGRLYPREDLGIPAGAVDQLSQVLPDVTRLPNKLPASSSLVARAYDRLVTYHDMEDTDKTAYDWSPVQIDRGKPGSGLSNYLMLPWGGPTQMVFPGFHTATEAGLKKPNANGDEVFLTSCAVLATGARTVLLSRWRVGGQSSYDLMREFVQELPHSSASEAWQRSVQLRLQADLDPAAEPRLKVGTVDEPLRPEHPFFWAGYMLLDTGYQPVRAGAQAAR